MTIASRLLLLTLAALGGSGCFAGAGVWVAVGSSPAERPPVASTVVAPDEAVAGDVPHTSVFYDPLADYGVWEQDPELGWIWSASDNGYVPYRDGHWVDTDAGPTWVADEPFGWAVSHYGRWFFRDRWYWVPGTEWAPAWVDWRVGEGVVGWAPRGPDRTPAAPIEGWSFVSAPDFYTRGLGMRRASASYAGWFLYRTRPWVRWAYHGDAPRYVVGPRVQIRGRPLVERVRLGSLPPEAVRWVPRWARPAVPRHWASVRAGPDGPERMQRAAPADPTWPTNRPWRAPHHHHR